MARSIRRVCEGDKLTSKTPTYMRKMKTYEWKQMTWASNLHFSRISCNKYPQTIVSISSSIFFWNDQQSSSLYFLVKTRKCWNNSSKWRYMVRGITSWNTTCHNLHKHQGGEGVMKHCVRLNELASWNNDAYIFFHETHGIQRQEDRQTEIEWQRERERQRLI